MLNKAELESMTRCGNIRGCHGCKAMGDFSDPRPSACVEKAAETALAYRELLEQAAELIETAYGNESRLSRLIREATHE